MCATAPRRSSLPKLLWADLFIHTSDYLRYLRRKQTATPLPTTPEKCHCKHYLVKCTIFHLTQCILHSSKRRWLSWVGIGGSEKNRLWCVANGISGKQCYSKCSEWPPSARIHASSVFRHWSIASSTTLCWSSAMSQQDASATRPYRRLVLDTREKMKKMKNLCILQGSAVTFFICGG